MSAHVYETYIFHSLASKNVFHRNYLSVGVVPDSDKRHSWKNKEIRLVIGTNATYNASWIFSTIQMYISLISLHVVFLVKRYIVTMSFKEKPLQVLMNIQMHSGWTFSFIENSFKMEYLQHQSKREIVPGRVTTNNAKYR